ncbi:MAG: AbrB/MazE/SpoVT family DNA-binding domain-containing protein [Coriobacteriia bacterium]|nr:AbrB/MazE/SpoVT family DNA-binding domain-containing protein [Actinomycetota bacterium]MDZ4166575.1 AbrB/MazE/SpoVT family DNA-binding domain-containing protein [Coriobacteriia bacterium]
MRVKTRKVGNSLTVTIPKELVTEMDLAEDTDMNIFVREGAVVLEPVVSRWERLVERVRTEAAARGTDEADVAAEMRRVRPGYGGPAPDADDESAG